MIACARTKPRSSRSDSGPKRRGGWKRGSWSRDSIPEDNRALLEIPALKIDQSGGVSDDPDTLRPALQAHPQIEPDFLPTADYRPDVKASVIILDRFAPRAAPKAPQIWIEPPEPLPFQVAHKGNGCEDRPLARGSRTRCRTSISGHPCSGGTGLRSFAGDIPIAEAEAGPIVVARPSSAIRSHGIPSRPVGYSVRPVTPLLLANVLRWFEPEVFRAYDLHGGSAGTVTATLDADVDLRT